MPYIPRKHREVFRWLWDKLPGNWDVLFRLGYKYISKEDFWKRYG